VAALRMARLKLFSKKVNSHVPLQVLLVEDSPLTAEQLCELIRGISFPVDIRTVDTHKDALTAVGQTSPHIVVLDLKLRQGSGFSVLRQLATMDPKPATVILTNYALPKYRELAELLGADFFLDKARDFALVPAVIEALAKRRPSLAS
jgi:DNA-binding response OmpR family regulator